ncbi:MAG: hypothetical protein WC878_06040 [Candidatus Paceibacterota bacterium]|jgi:hypothetical protein
MEQSPMEKQKTESKNISIEELLRIPKDEPNPYIALQNKLDEIILEKRDSLWTPGEVEDIKIGDYFVEYGGMDLHLCDVVGKYASLGEDMDAGLAYGLEKNVLIEADGTPILVADLHNFAAPFILEAIESGKLQMGSSMDHLDFHSDMGSTDEKEFTDYTPKNLSEKEKVRYLLKNSRIGTWQNFPIIESGAVAKDKWRWLRLNESGAWIQKDEKEKTIDEKPTMDHEPDILDIDLDFLCMEDEKLSEEEKRGVLSGIIPKNIADKISDTIHLSVKAKIITLVTSPTFIHQKRAIEYAKYFIGKYKESKKEK